MLRNVLQQLLLHFNPTSSNPDDQRYPRTKRLRLLRWIGIHWWQGLLFIFSAFFMTFYLPIAFTNLSNLFLQGGSPSLFNFPNVTHALLPNQLLPQLVQSWNTRRLLVIVLIICVLLLVLLVLWAYPDQKRERIVLALRDERDKQRQNDERTATVIRKVINPSLPQPFDEVAARNRYLETMNRLYSSVQLPIGRSQDISLHAVFQPLKLRRDPLAVEDLEREERRKLLGESRAQFVEQDSLLSGSSDQHSIGLSQQTRPNVLADNGNDALAKSHRNRIVFLGGPGTGKTTLLKSMLSERISKAQLEPNFPLPIFVSLPAFINTGKSLKDFLADGVQNMMVDDRYAGFLWKAIRDGQAFVCLDSLDEVMPSKRADVIGLINTWISNPGNTWIIGSRFTEYKNGQLSGHFTEWELRPMDNPLREELAKRLIEKLHPLLHQTDGVAPCEPSKFVHALEEHPRTSAWGENPLLFSLAAIVFVRTGRLPLSRTEMYKNITGAVLDSHTNDSLSRFILHSTIGEVALELYQVKGRTFTIGDLFEVLSKVHRRRDETWDVEDMAHRIIGTGAVEVVAKSTYGFRHQTFQEYLAASTLAKRMLDHDEGAWELAYKKHTYSRWTEILVLLVGVLLQEHGKAGAQLAVHWLDELLAQGETADGDPGDLALVLALKSLGEAAITKNRFWQESGGIELERKAAEMWIRDFTDAIQKDRESLEKRLLALSHEIGTLSLPAILATIQPLMNILCLHSDFNFWVLHEQETSMQALKVLCERAPLDPLISALSDKDSFVRSNVIQILGDLGERAPIDSLISALQDNDYFVRVAAVEAFGKIKSPSALAALVTQWDQDKDTVGREVIEALGNFGLDAPVDVVLEALHDKDGSIRKAAVEALGRLKERVPADSILTMLHDQDQEPRKTAIEALGSLGVGVPIDQLVALLQDTESDVRLTTIQALGKLGERTPIDVLTAIWNDNKEDEDVRRAALDALGERAPIDALFSALQDKHFFVRSAAIEALGKMGARAPIDVLKMALDDPDWYVRAAAVKTLGIRTPMEKLISCLHDSIVIMQEGSPDLGIAALEVLGAIGEHVPIEPLVDAVANGRYGVRSAAVRVLGNRTSIELLLIALNKSEEEYARVIAVEQLAAMGKTAPVESFEIALKDSDKRVRKAALQALVVLREQAPIEAVVAALRDSESDVCEAAVKALGALKERAPIEPLIAALHDDNLAISAAAIQSLSALGVRAPIDVFMELLYHQNSYIRYATVRALEALREGVPAEPLVAALHGANEEVRETAARVLGALGQRAPIDPLVAALHDSKKRVRAAAAEAIGKLGDRAPIEPLVAALHDDEAEVRRALVQTLGVLGERVPIEPLVAATYDKDIGVRRKAVDALGGRASRELLLTALRDKSVFVQAAAIRALGKLGDRAPIQLFLKVLDFDSDIGRAAVEALQRQKEHVPIEPLINALNSERPLVRERALEVLGVLGERVPVEPLLVSLHDRYTDVRKAAVEALGMLGDHVPVEQWMIALGDSEPAVRKAAITNLGKRVPIELILAALGDSATEVRHAAIEVLQDIHVEDLVTIKPGVEAIIHGQGTTIKLDSYVQCYIAKIIGEMVYAPPPLLDELTRLLDWPYWEVRMKAAEALGKLHRNIPDPAILRLFELRDDSQSKAVSIAADDALAEILSVESIEDDLPVD